LAAAAAALATAAVVADIAVNTSFDYDSDAGTLSVSIPPPSTFTEGVPLPIFLGFEGTFDIVPIPGTSLKIGIPAECDTTVDPSLAPALPGGAEAVSEATQL